jgi:hypothetical protein
MPFKLGRKIFRSQKEAAQFLRKSRPDIKDPAAYMASIEKTIEERRTLKKKSNNKK